MTPSIGVIDISTGVVIYFVFLWLIDGEFHPYRRFLRFNRRNQTLSNSCVWVPVCQRLSVSDKIPSVTINPNKGVHRRCRVPQSFPFASLVKLQRLWVRHRKLLGHSLNNPNKPHTKPHKFICCWDRSKVWISTNNSIIRGRPRTNRNALEWGCRPIEISGRPIETSFLCTLY